MAEEKGRSFTSWIKAFTPEILGAFTLAFTVFFFAPTYLFILNLAANVVSLKESLPGFILATVVGFVIFSLLAILAYSFLRKHILAVLLVLLAIAFLVQGMYLNVDIGLLNGLEVDFRILGNLVWIDLLIWAVILIGGLVLYRLIEKNFRFLAGLIIFAQLALLISIVIPNWASLMKQEVTSNDNGNYLNFSTEKNVIVILLDSFSQVLYEDITINFPKYREILKDFTEYENVIGAFPTTKPSIPFILSGEPYDNSEEFSKYLVNTEGYQIQNVMRDNGYETVLFTAVPIQTSVGWDRMSYVTASSGRVDLLSKQYVLVGIRFLPNSLKPILVKEFFAGSGGSFHESMLNFLKLIPQVEAKAEHPVFEFIHLSGTHAPAQLSEDLTLVKTGTTPAEQGKASLNLLAAFLQKLKEIHVYDESLIMVVADHGHDMTSTVIDPQSLVANKARPIFLIKLPSEEHDSSPISSASLMTGDLPGIIQNYLDSTQHGNVNDPLPERETRIFSFYSWEDADWNESYLPPFLNFQVRGEVSAIENWEYLSHSSPPLSVHKPVTFTPGVNVLDSQVLNSQRSNFINFDTNVPNGKVHGQFPIACINGEYSGSLPVTIKIMGTPFPPPIPGIQPMMDVYVNDEIVDRIALEPQMSVNVEHRRVSEDNPNEFFLCFGFPDAVSPYVLGWNKDNRLLGYTFQSIIVNGESSESAPLTGVSEFVVNAGVYADLPEFLLSGWSLLEPNFVWTEGKEATMLFSIPKPSETIQVELELLPFLAGGQLLHQEVRVFANDQPVGTWQVKEKGLYAVEVPRDALLEGVLELRLELPNAISPAEAKVSTDVRVLGVALSKVIITP